MEWVWQYLCLWLLNLTILNTAAMMKNNSMGSNRMYWEMVMQPVSVEKNQSGLIYSGVIKEVHGGMRFFFCYLFLHP